MSLTYVTHNQRRRAGMVMFALAILGLCMATYLLLQESFGIDQLYGLLD